MDFIATAGCARLLFCIFARVLFGGEISPAEARVTRVEVQTRRERYPSRLERVLTAPLPNE